MILKLESFGAGVKAESTTLERAGEEIATRLGGDPQKRASDLFMYGCCSTHGRDWIVFDEDLEPLSGIVTALLERYGVDKAKKLLLMEVSQ